MKSKGIIKVAICLLAAILVLTAGAGWAETIQTSGKKIHVHEQMFDNEQIFSKNAGMGLMNYGSPPFDNANYYYAAVKTAPSGVWYRQAGLSPNGQKIVAQKSFTDGSYSRTEIVLMNANGTGEIIISAGNSGEGDIYGYMNPFWSDDGTVVGFAEVHNSNPNKIVRYVVSSGTSSYIYEPVSPLDAANPDFLGTSTTSIVFWAYGPAGGADLFTWDGSTLTNITNTSDYKEYEPVSNSDGTVILYWSGETTAEPVNTTHTLTYSGGVWTKDVGFTPITDSYWPYWSSRSDNYIGVTVMSSKDIYVYSNTGTFVFDLTGPGYSGGSGQWNFIGFAFEGPNGEIVATSNAGRTDPGRDIIFAAPRTKLFVASTGSDSYPGTFNAPFLTINKGVTEAISGGSVNVAAGTYNENLNITKQLTISGAGKNDVTLNPSAATYGIGVGSPGNSVTIEKLTVNAGSAKFFLIHVSGVSNFTLQDAKVVGPGRLVLSGGEALGGVDLINVTTAMIKDVEVKDLSRNGVSAGHSSNISLENLVVNNIGSTTGWAGVAAYTALGNTSITFSGTNTVTNTSMGLYLEDNPTRTVTITAPVGSITFSGQSVAPIVRFGYGSAPGLEATALGLGLRARLTSPERPAPYDKGVAFYYTVAEAVAAGALDPIGKLYAVVYDLQINEWFVGPGMVIQRAVNAASAGNKVNVLAGTYSENVVINKHLTLSGAGVTTIIQAILQPTIHKGYCIEIMKEGNGLSTSDHTVIKNLRVTGGYNGVEFHHYGNDPPVTDTIKHITLQNLTGDHNISEGYPSVPGAYYGNEGDAVHFEKYTHYRDIVIDNLTATDNAGFGINSGSGVGSINDLTVTGGYFARNVYPGFEIYYGHNIIINGASFEGNGIGYDVEGDIVLTNLNSRGNGNLSITDVTITSNGASTGLRISGSGTLAPAGIITLSNLTINGTQVLCPGGNPWGSYPSAAIVISRYSDVSNVNFDNVNLNSTAPVGLFLGTIYNTPTAPTLDLTGISFNGTYGQLITLGRHGNNPAYSKANVNVDARNAVFTGLTDNFAIEDKITHKLDDAELGLVTWVANNVYVTPTSGSIQRGIDAVTGSTVNVAAGMYVENVVVTKSVDLIGAGLATTTINGNNVGNAVTITASDVTLSGFRVTGGWKQGSTPVWYEAGGVVVNGNGGTSSLTGITIQDNSIDGNAGNGVYVSAAGHDGTADNVIIINNQIFNNGSGGSCAGVSLTYRNYIVRDIGVWDEWRRPKNIRVELNNIYSNSEYGVYVSAGQNVRIQSNDLYSNSKYGLQLTPSWNRTDIPCEYTTVDSNNIHDNIRNGVKLTSYNKHNTFTVNTISNNGSGGTSDYYKYGFLFQDGNDNVIQNNTITGNALGGLYLWGQGDPSYTWYSTTNNTITGNKISNHTAIGGHGIYIPAKGGYPNSGFLNSDIYDNILMCNQSNAKDDCSGNSWDNGVDTGNFWDDWASNSGYPTQYNVPGTAGSVDHFPQAPMVVWVDDDWAGTTCGDSVGGHLFGYDAFDKIQDGVNKVASNGTVNVLAGIYEEQVEITKSLTLQGAGAGSTTIKSPINLTKFFSTGPNNYPIVYVHDVPGVNINDFTVDGAGRGNANYRFIGIGYRNAGGNVSSCTIKDIRNTPIDGAQHGVGIYALADNGVARTLNVLNNTLYGFQKNGMALFGANLTVLTKGNNVTGAGAINFIAQNGIQLGTNATGVIDSNAVNGFAYTPFTWSSTGILVYGASGSVSVTRNNVTESMVGIWYINAQGVISSNFVSNTIAGMGATPYWWGIVADPGNGKAKQPPASVFDAGLGSAKSEVFKSLIASLTTTVNRNVMNGGGNGTGIEADALGTETLNFSANENSTANWTAGFVLYKDPGATLNGVVLGNSIVGNAYGFVNQTGVLQDASANWWGSAGGPKVTSNSGGAGDSVSADVDYTPWLDSGVDMQLGTPGFQGDFSVLNVFAGSPQIGLTGRIQEGINLVSGSTVKVLVGIYNENIVIHKSLTLLGAGQSSVFVYPAISDIGQPNPEAGPSFRGSQMCVVQASDVTIDGFTFDGDSPTLTPPGTIDARNGIITNYYAGNWSNLKVQNCTVKNIYLRGIYSCAKDANTPTGISFHDNTVTNVKGVSMQSAAIMLWGSTGDVKKNTISDASIGVMYHWYSDGMVDSNTISNCEVAIAVNSNDDTTTVSKNTITDSDQGIQTISTLHSMDVANNGLTNCYWGMVAYGGGDSPANFLFNKVQGPSSFEAIGFYASTDISPWGMGDVYATLKNNTITKSFWGVVLSEPSTNTSKLISMTIGGSYADHNFIYDNINYEVLMDHCNDNVNARYNYWGKSSLQAIELDIYHKVDESKLGLVDFGHPIILGDVDQDGDIDLADVIYLANYILKGGATPPLMIVCDVNHDGKYSLADVVFLANYILKGGPPPLIAKSTPSDRFTTLKQAKPEVVNSLIQ